MSNIINEVRIKQRSLVITSLDLKNTFDEVHHNLIYIKFLNITAFRTILIILLQASTLDFIHQSLLLISFHTSYNPVRRCVLQSHCLSPLLFNLCCNTFIQHIKAPNYRQFGFLLDHCKSLNPVHWFQFADDAVVISGQKGDNQQLLTCFTIWYT